MIHRFGIPVLLLLPIALAWACGGPPEPPADPPKIEAVHPTVEKGPPASSSEPK